EQVVRNLLDSPGDPVAVQRAQGVERLKHHQAQGPLQNFTLRLAHCASLWGVNRSNHSTRSVECQQGRRNAGKKKPLQRTLPGPILDRQRTCTRIFIRPICMIQPSAMENPFQFGRELGAGELVDREEEIAEVARTLREGGKLFLVGPRRFGKTSVLKAAEDRLLSEGAVVLRCDAESYPSLDLLVAKLISLAANRLKGTVERTGERIRGFFAKLRPEASFSVTDHSWTVKLGVAAIEDASKHIELLVDALDGLENLAKAQPKARAVGLVIDEFQKVVELGGRMAESQIRAAIQRHERT